MFRVRAMMKSSAKICFGQQSRTMQLHRHMAKTLTERVDRQSAIFPTVRECTGG